MTDISAFLREPHNDDNPNERKDDITTNGTKQIWVLVGDEPAPPGALVWPTAYTDTHRIWLAVRSAERNDDEQKMDRCSGFDCYWPGNNRDYHSGDDITH